MYMELIFYQQASFIKKTKQTHSIISVYMKMSPHLDIQRMIYVCKVLVKLICLQSLSRCTHAQTCLIEIYLETEYKNQTSKLK